MHHQVSDADLAVLLAEADAAAARLRRRLNLPATDHGDLHQELLVDLIRRLPAFDRDRGNIGPFAGVILRNHSVRIAARLVRERRAAGGPLLSLDASDENGRTLADQLTEADGLATWHGRAATSADHRMAVSAVVSQLAPRDQSLCAAVAHWSVDQLVDRGFGSRAGIYRRLRELRSQITAHGLQAA